jgi:hypothetical protein
MLWQNYSEKHSIHFPISAWMESKRNTHNLIQKLVAFDGFGGRTGCPTAVGSVEQDLGVQTVLVEVAIKHSRRTDTDFTSKTQCFRAANFTFTGPRHAHTHT